MGKDCFILQGVLIPGQLKRQWKCVSTSDVFDDDNFISNFGPWASKGIRVTIWLSDGTVIYDNSADVQTMPNHGTYIEGQIATSCHCGGATVRFSADVGQKQVFWGRWFIDGGEHRFFRMASNTDKNIKCCTVQCSD